MLSPATTPARMHVLLESVINSILARGTVRKGSKIAYTRMQVLDVVDPLMTLSLGNNACAKTRKRKHTDDVLVAIDLRDLKGNAWACWLSSAFVRTIVYYSYVCRLHEL